MLRRNSIVLFVATVLVLQTGATRVEILYETHCPDSQQLMTDGVRKSLKLLPEVEFIFVPYGKASTSGEGSSLSFQCQHGAKECEGNMYHACAIELHPNKKEVAEFAICSMNYRQNVKQNMEQCAKQHQIDYGALQTCAAGQQGKDLLARMGVQTQAAAKKINGGTQLDFVPSTLIDGEQFVFEAYRDLYRTICTRAKQKPSKC